MDGCGYEEMYEMQKLLHLRVSCALLSGLFLFLVSAPGIGGCFMQTKHYSTWVKIVLGETSRCCVEHPSSWCPVQLALLTCKGGRHGVERYYWDVNLVQN